MSFSPTVIVSIGNTPLINLRAASAATGCTILGKAEFTNPGGSVKDRAALAIVRDAMASGMLQPGGVIVEGTAGNTGIGIGMVAAALGFRSVIVIPDTQAQEKKDMLRMVGADLIEVPAAPYRTRTTTSGIRGDLPKFLQKRNRAARSGPTSSTTSPTAAATTKPPARRSGSRPRGASTASSARSGPAARSPASPWR